MDFGWSDDTDTTPYRINRNNYKRNPERMFRRTRKGLVEMIYDVEIKPDEDYWFIKVPSINRVTQAKNLKEVDDMAKDLITIMTGEQNPEITVKMQLPQTVSDAIQLRKKTEALENKTRIKQREAVRTLHGMGFTFRDIGKTMGISYQRAHQLAD